MIHKGYLCYDHKLRYVLVSRNVIFLNMFIILLLYQSIPRTSISILQNFLDPKETANSPTYRSLIVYQHRKNKKDLMITSSPFRWKLSQYPHPSFGYSRQPTTQWYSTCSQVLCVSKILTFFQNLNSFFSCFRHNLDSSNVWASFLYPSIEGGYGKWISSFKREWPLSFKDLAFL